MKILAPLRRISKFIYEIPDEYHNSFYLANASLFQIVNYFVHKSYQVVFSELIQKVKNAKPDFTDSQAETAIRDFIKNNEQCNNFIDVYFPFKRCHGVYDMVRGMRAYHGAALNNTSLGGFRMCENLNRHTVRGFAVLSTYRNACYGLDLAGSHGGLKICPTVYDTQDMKEVVQTYAKKLSAYHGTVDIVEPDLHCSTTEMGYMNEVCADNSNILIMGKPVTDGGLSFYQSAGPKAVLLVLKMFMENKMIEERIHFGGALKDKTYIIEGLGKMGSEIAKLMAASGAICVGVKDQDCTLYDTGGIHVKALLKHYKKYGTILKFSAKAKETASEQIFTELCDILILAALERSVTCHIADKIKAKVIVEACNGPISPTADKILTAKAKLVIPTILAGGGHTLMSYLEYTKNNISDAADSEKEVDNVFESMLRETTQEIFRIEEELNLNLNFREAAYVKAIRKIFDKLIQADFAIQDKERMLSMQ